MGEQLTRTMTRDGRKIDPVCPSCRHEQEIDFPWAERRTYRGDILLLFRERTPMTCEHCSHKWTVVVTAQPTIHNEESEV